MVNFLSETPCGLILKCVNNKAHLRLFTYTLRSIITNQLDSVGKQR